jgi:hypothetical protein
MALKVNTMRKFSRLFNNQRGTAEIVGSIMFLLILLFFFTNVYLWHDVATREMDSVLADRMNSPVSIQIVGSMGPTTRLNVTNKGGVSVALSRLWVIITEDNNHYPIDLEGQNIWVSAGETVDLPPVPNVPPEKDVTFKILTVLGNTATCTDKYTVP